MQVATNMSRKSVPTGAEHNTAGSFKSIDHIFQTFDLNFISNQSNSRFFSPFKELKLWSNHEMSVTDIHI